MSRICFAMIGTQKCGTSTTLGAFREHPQIYMDDVELFHSGIPRGGRQRLRDELLAKAQDKVIVGPMHPDFSFFRRGKQMQVCFGSELKLLMTVRDPVKRAISNYWMEVQRNTSLKYTMFQALTNPDHHFVRRGHYHRDLVQFLTHFPRDQLLITRLEDMAEDTAGILNRMARWIGADPFLPDQEHERVRVGHYASEPPDGVVSYLAEHYAESNRLLHEDFGVRVDDWTA